MELIRTEDGVIGLKYSDTRPPTWCESIDEAIRIGWGHFAAKPNHGFNVFARDIRYAIDTMVNNKHTVAVFGIWGSFMYTKQEDL